MGTTSRGYPTPEGSDNLDVPGDLSALASAINTDVGSVDTAKAAKATTITAGTGLTGGGDLSANRTLAVSYGTTAGTAAQGNDSRITGAVQSSLVDAKGDLYVGTADNTVARLAAPADGRVLVADSTQTAGWTSAAMGNLLPPNVATGTDTLGTTAGFTAAVANIESSTDRAYQGTRSLKVTQVTSSGRADVGGGSTSGNIPVTPGQTYTFSLWMWADSVTYRSALRIFWWTSAGNVAASTPQTVGIATDATVGAWTLFQVTGVAPANAAFASGVPLRSSGGDVGAVYYYDQVGFHQGAGGLWAPPGVPTANLGTYTDESVGRRIFTWDAVNNRWQMTYGDTGLRNIASVLENGWTASPLLLRRTGSTVTLTSTGLSSAAATASTFYTLPVGFRPSTNHRQTIGLTHVVSVTTTVIAISTTPYNDISDGRFSWSWTTADSWPTTSLPGTAHTSPAIPS